MRVERSLRGENSTAVSGVPFFARKVQRLQRTEYEQQWVDIALQLQLARVQPAGCGETTNTVQLMRDERSGRFLASQATRAMLDAVRALSGSKEPTDEAEGRTLVESVLARFLKTHSMTEADRFTPTASMQPHLTANVYLDSVVVDYTTQYFLNGTHPWFGTASLDFALLPDGTLSTAKSAVDSKAGDVATGVLTSALGVLPVRELFEKRWGLGAKESTAPVTDPSPSAEVRNLRPGDKLRSCKAPAPRFTVALDLKTTPGRTVWTFTKSDSLGKAPISFDFKTGHFSRREEITAAPTMSAEKSDLPKIGFEGSVTLPKKP